MALSIIGAGVGRTGTASLKVALELLGTGQSYHMSDVLQNPERVKTWLGVAGGDADWDAIFEGYGSSVDYPGCTFWTQLADHYPEAKIILTVRDAGRWYDSINETIMSQMLVEGTKGSPFGELMQKIVWGTVDNRMQDKDYMVRPEALEALRRHSRRAQRTPAPANGSVAASRPPARPAYMPDITKAASR